MARNFEINQDPFSNARFLEVANRAVGKAVETHRRLGQSIVVMRDGKPTWIAAEDIPPLENNEPQRHRENLKKAHLKNLCVSAVQI